MLRWIMGIVFLVLGPFSVYAGTLNYVGSSTVGKFIADASMVYTTSTFKLDTRPESGGGEKAAARGSCDLAGVARSVGSKYLEQGVVVTLFGKDAIAAVVHQGNPVSGLTTSQLKGIFTGQITNWKEVGGPDLKITPYVVKKESATRKVFAEAVLGAEDYAGVEVMTPDAKIPTVVGREKGAIGQISLAFILENPRVKPLDVDGQIASVENPFYPITRPLHLVTKGEPQGEVKAFIDWALSVEGQKVVKQRFVGI